MPKSRLIGVVAILLLTSAFTVEAQQTKKLPRIGWLSAGSPKRQQSGKR